MKRSAQQTSIQQFFAKKTCPNVKDDSCSVPSTSSTTISAENTTVSEYETNSLESNFLNNECGNDVSCKAICNLKDIGYYCGEENLIKSLSNEEKHSLLINIWTPDRIYKFPKIANSNQTHFRSFQIKWLEEYKWLAYSEMKAGSFCKYCVLLASDVAGNGCHQTLGALVTKPFTNLKSARGSFKQHENCNYHKHAMLTADNIKSIISKKMDTVINQIDTQRKMDVIENRKKLLPIIQTIRLCGRQQMPLRGKRDTGRIYLHEPINNDGIFRSILRYRANSGDLELKKHLETSGGKSMYTSSVIQNELITIFGDLIVSEIVSNVQKTKFYSVLADETTDISQI